MLSGTTDRGGAPGVLEAVTRGLFISLTGDSNEASRILAEAEVDLRTLDRHYDAACVALDLAVCLDHHGDAPGAAAAHARASTLLVALHGVNPY
jgi:hypothetical protein